MLIATLGPEGTFSHAALQKYDPGARILFCRSIRDVFLAVDEGRADKGIVPVENSVGGAVTFTMDSFLEHDLTIEAELVVPISHCLMATRILPFSEIGKLYLHGQTFIQCEKFIREEMPTVRIQEVFSNAEAARLVLAEGNNTACIGPALAATTYGLERLRQNVQDNCFNATRFLAVSHYRPAATGYDKTSVLVYPQSDHPGLLWRILGVFQAHGVNLTKIESRPAKGKLGDYVFFLDLAGHEADKDIADSLEELGDMVFIKRFGSYPRKF